MAAQSDLMRGWLERTAFYCLYNISMREIRMDKWVHTGRNCRNIHVLRCSDLRANKICLSVRSELWSSHSLQGSHSPEPPENPALFKTHISVLPNLLLSSACFTSELQPDQWAIPPCPTAAPTKTKAETLRRHISSRDGITNRKSCDTISQLSTHYKEVLREQVTSLTPWCGFWPRPELV